MTNGRGGENRRREREYAQENFTGGQGTRVNIVGGRGGTETSFDDGKT